MSEDGFRELAQRCAALAPRVAAVLEGGYNLATLPTLVDAAHRGLHAVLRRRNGRLAPAVSATCRTAVPRKEIAYVTCIVDSRRRVLITQRS